VTRIKDDAQFFFLFFLYVKCQSGVMISLLALSLARHSILHGLVKSLIHINYFTLLILKALTLIHDEC
jgi:hypothetical protein